MKYFLPINIFLLTLIIFLSFYLYFKQTNDVEYRTLKQTEIIETNNSTNQLNVLFVGDIMLDRYIRKQIQEYKSTDDFVNNFLTNLSKVNSKYDLVIGNLEGPITNSSSKTLNKDGSFNKELTFTFPSSSVEILKALNVKAVSLANNHTNNFGLAGFLETENFLEAKEILHFGNPYNQEQYNLQNIYCEKEICLGLIGYNQFTENNDPEIINTQIKLLRENPKVDFVIVFAHFGEEYKLEANSTQVKYAHGWVDAGADLIIGAHPHVIQNTEIYKGKYIYYSLGNYIFDQWFNQDVVNGLAVNFKFSKKDINGVVSKEIKFSKDLKVKISKESIKYLGVGE